MPTATVFQCRAFSCCTKLELRGPLIISTPTSWHPACTFSHLKGHSSLHKTIGQAIMYLLSPYYLILARGIGNMLSLCIYELDSYLCSTINLTYLTLSAPRVDPIGNNKLNTASQLLETDVALIGVFTESPTQTHKSHLATTHTQYRQEVPAGFAQLPASPPYMGWQPYIATATCWN